MAIVPSRPFSPVRPTSSCYQRVTAGESARVRKKRALVPPPMFNPRVEAMYLTTSNPVFVNKDIISNSLTLSQDGKKAFILSSHFQRQRRNKKGPSNQDS